MTKTLAHILSTIIVLIGIVSNNLYYSLKEWNFFKFLFLIIAVIFLVTPAINNVYLVINKYLNSRGNGKKN